MASVRRLVPLIASLLLVCAPTADAAFRHLGDRPLRVGSRGDDVRNLQKLLTRSGFAVSVDGRFGASTRRGVRRFQEAAHLRASGVADRPTITALRAAARSVASPSPDGGATAFGTTTAPGAPAASTATGGPVGQATLTADGLAVAPADAPAAVVAMIAAANHIATLPYRYGGGHGDFEDDAYDCSGSVSYALHGAGLLDSPLDSGSLAAWGRSGAGRWVTIFANDEHVYMVVAGLRFDTSGQRDTGSRWQSAMRSSDGFVVRHPDAL